MSGSLSALHHCKYVYIPNSYACWYSSNYFRYFYNQSLMWHVLKKKIKKWKKTHKKQKTEMVCQTIILSWKRRGSLCYFCFVSFATVSGCFLCLSSPLTFVSCTLVLIFVKVGLRQMQAEEEQRGTTTSELLILCSMLQLMRLCKWKQNTF